jgi:hypothetical protein
MIVRFVEFKILFILLIFFIFKNNNINSPQSAGKCISVRLKSNFLKVVNITYSQKY